MHEKLNEAIAFAAERHKGQVRKSSVTPYIMHPLEVAAIIASLTDDEEIMIAGLLHDTVEDTDTTPQEITERFGERVAQLVNRETENKRSDLPPGATWKIRKEETLAVLKNSTDTAVKIMWLADKLSNARSVYRCMLKVGDAVFDIFNEKDKKMHEWYYRSVAEYTAELNGTAAYIEFSQLLDKIFGKGEQQT